MGSVNLTAELTDIAVPVTLTIADGTTGLSPLVAIRDPGTAGSYLDFNDNTFKTAGHTTRQETMAEIDATDSPGVYETSLNVNAWSGLTANSNHVVIEYKVTVASIDNFQSDALLLVNHSYDIAIAGDAMDLVADAVDATAIATDAIGADAIAADAIGSSELATSAVNEIRDAILSDSTPFPGASITEARLAELDAGNLPTDIANVQSDTDDIQTRLPAALVGGRIDASVGAVAAGAIDAAAIATDAIDADALAADAVAEIADGVWDEAKAGHVGVGSFGEEVQTHSLSTEVAAVEADTQDIQSRLPSALVGGRMDSDVGNIQAGAIDAAAIATDAIDADAIATDAIGALELSAGAAGKIADAAWNEVLAGHLSPGSTGKALDDAAAGASPGGVADAVWDEAKSGHVAAGSFGEEVQLHSLSTEVAAVQADTDNIQTRLPGALVGGRMDSDVGNMQAGTVNAAAVATDAIDADALATDAVSEISTDVDTVLTAAHGAGAWNSEAHLRVEQAWTRSITSPAGSRIRGIFALHQGGQFVALPGTSRLAIEIRDSSGTLIDSVTGLAPNSEGYFERTFDPWTLVQGTVDISIATITLSGIGSGTHVSTIVIAWPDFVATV